MLPEFLERKHGEEYIEWKFRLLLAKLNRETDLDWADIRDILGETCSADHLRKTAYGIREYHDYLESKKAESITDSDVLNELEMKKIELREERSKLQSIRVDYNRLIREKARRDLIFELLRDGFETLPVPELIIDPSRYQTGNRKAILAFGDAHWGKVFESHWNKYSPEVFEERMKRVAEETVTYLHKEGFDEVEILSMADSIEGMTLRISQLQSLRVGFIDQVIMFSKFMAAWLKELSRHFTKITYHHVPSSNHSEVRPFSTGRSEFPAEDFEKVIINYLSDVLKDNPRIEIPIYKEGVIDFKTLEFNHVATHGHLFNKNKNLLKDISFHRQQFYDVLWIAHYHHSDVVTVGETDTHNLEIITIPSIMGSDRYSDRLLTGSKPGAVINIFETGKGRVDQHNIILN